MINVKLWGIFLTITYVELKQVGLWFRVPQRKLLAVPTTLKNLQGINL